MDEVNSNIKKGDIEYYVDDAVLIVQNDLQKFNNTSHPLNKKNKSFLISKGLIEYKLERGNEMAKRSTLIIILYKLTMSQDNVWTTLLVRT